ncbi:hypothetical protein [Yersinia alsatica]|uniref:hypothetical protein n=1 Tax=Yersinia alsatica TaxID=2890317 RepID=UPI0011A42E2A|nr:hypothetical protein [Yersinia alsatica]
MIEKLVLTKNAQFYSLKDDLEETIDDVIKIILNESCVNIDESEGKIIDLTRKERFLNEQNIPYTYSVHVFPTLKDVYFLDADELDITYQDRIYAYIIIFEFGQHIAIIKKSCANISDCVDRYLQLFSGNEIANTFNDSDVAYQKISLRNMTVSDKAIRSRSYEAADLKGTFSTHAAGRSIPSFIKYRHGTTVKTISGTGRLVESSHRVSFDSIASWVHQQLTLIKNGGHNKEFLDAFAKSKDLKEVLNSGVTPNAILIESASLYDHLKENGLSIKYLSNVPGVNGTINQVTMNDEQEQILLRYLERVFSIDPNGKIICALGNAHINTNKTITFDSSFLRKLKVHVGGQDITLQNYIIKNGFYSVTFTDHRFMYYLGNCFEDVSGISEIDSILKMFHPVSSMADVLSEKGAFRINSVNFSKNSMFRLVENMHKKDDYIFCDDLGTEWADHITFNEKESCINFIHSKHGLKSTSASNLHDVVGQAIKNLGYMNSSAADFNKKAAGTFSQLYKNKKCQTRIHRTRKGNLSNFTPYLEKLFTDYKLHRKCIISCSFLSEKVIKSEFLKVKNGQKVRGHVTQLLWILSSFSHAAKDASVIPIIYCAK